MLLCYFSLCSGYFWKYSEKDSRTSCLNIHGSLANPWRVLSSMWPGQSIHLLRPGSQGGEFQVRAIWGRPLSWKLCPWGGCKGGRRLRSLVQTSRSQLSLAVDPTREREREEMSLNRGQEVKCEQAPLFSD